MKRFDIGVALLAIALCLGAATRLWDLAGHGLHVDEAFTFAVAAKAPDVMLHDLTYGDFHPPLFYALTHVALLWFHWDAPMYRYLTAPLSLVTIVATWAVGRRLFGPIAGGLAALLVAIDPTLITWERLYRMYVVLTALVAVSWWLLIAANDASGVRRTVLWLLFGVCAVLQPYVQYLGAINVACQSLYALTRVRTAWPALAAAGAAAIAFVPWIGAVRIQYAGGGLAAGTQTLPIYWWVVAREAIAAGTPLTWLQTLFFDPLFTLAVVAVCVWGAWRGRMTILPFWLGVALVQLVITVAAGKFLVGPRYLLPVIPALAISLGALFAYVLQSKAQLAGAAAGLVTVAYLALCSTNVLADPFYQFADWNAVSAIVSARVLPGDAVIFDQGYPYVVFRHDTVFLDRDVSAPLSSNDLDGALAWLRARSGRRIWYIENQFYYVDPDRRIVATLQAARPRVAEWIEARAELSNRVYIALFGAERR